MNRKQKLKKYFKENWLLYFFLVLSLVLGFYGLFNSKHKTNNKLVESEFKQAEVLRRKNAMPSYDDLAILLNPMYSSTLVKVGDVTTDYSGIDLFNHSGGLFQLKETQFLEELFYDIHPVSFTLTFGAVHADAYKFTYYVFNNINQVNTYYIDNHGYKLLRETFDVPLNLNGNSWSITPTRAYDYIEFVLSSDNFNDRVLFNINSFNPDILSNNYDILLNNYNNLVAESDAKIAELTAKIVSQYQTIQQLQNTIDASSSLVPVVNTAISTPFNMIHNMLNFDIFGINLYAVLSFICTLCLVFFIIRKLL